MQPAPATFAQRHVGPYIYQLQPLGMHNFFSVVLGLMGYVLCAQQPVVFQRLQAAEDYWYQTTGLQSVNTLDTCPTSQALQAFFMGKFGQTAIYQPLAADYAAFFARHRCEALSLYEEVAHYQMEQFRDNHYADFLEANLYLAVYLSGLNPLHETTHDRKGLWRLTYPIARKYGLRVDELVDERYAAIQATQAAWWYYFDLKRLYDQEDLVRLAMATSPAMVEKYVQQSITNETGPSQLPAEARQLLFELDLLKLLFQPGWFQIKTNRIAQHFNNFVQLQPTGKVAFDVLASFTQLPVQKIREWNPVFVGGVFPEQYTTVPLYLPKEAAKLFQQHAAAIYAASKVAAVVPVEVQAIPSKPIATEVAQPEGALFMHTIKPGESLGLLAEKYMVRLSDLKSWNNIKGETIFAGQKLKIYTAAPTSSAPPAPKPTVATTSKPTPTTKSATKDPNPREERHVVASGETLWKISRKYPGVSPEDIMEWNNLASPSIYAGQKLVIKSQQ